MTQTINSLSWDTSDPANAIAAVNIDTAVDNTWAIRLVGNYQIGSANIVPGYMTVDNILNNATCVAFIGAYTWVVPAFSRKTFKLPQSPGTVQINGTVGKIAVYFSQTNALSPDDSNWLAIQEDALGITVFPWTLYNAINQPQIADDLASNIGFVPAANSVYLLLPIAATPIKNGAFSWLHNLSEFIVKLTPSGADTINSQFTFAKPMFLYPGQSAYLSSDGAQWYVRVLGGKRGIQNSPGAVLAQTLNDVGGRVTFSSGAVQTYNLISPALFEIGDEVQIACKGAGRLSVIPNGADTINGVFTAASPLKLSQYDSGVLYVDAGGNWAFTGETTFQSGLQPWGRAITGSAAHGLGKTPRKVELWLQCTGAQNGYAVGDQFPFLTGADAGSVPILNAIVADNANINWTFGQRGNSFVLSDRVTGLSFTPSATGGIIDNFAAFFRAVTKW